MIGGESFVDLILDPAHWGLEGVSEVAFFVVEVVILDRLLHRIHPVIRPRHGRRADHRRKR
jgi:hypothetical protein